MASRSLARSCLRAQAPAGVSGRRVLAPSASGSVLGGGSSTTSAGVRTYSTDDKPTFKGQMMESISSRIAREKAEQERLARGRQESASSRNAATTFMILFAAVSCYWLGTKYPRDPDPHSTISLDAVRPPKHKTGRAELEAAWGDFVEIVGKENVNTVEEILQQHASSEWSTYQRDAKAEPFCVIYPASTEEVSRIMKVCHVRRIPVTAFSGGTSLEGHFTPTRGGVCIDFGRMNKVLQLHKADLDVVVQPAVGWQDLNEELAEQGLFFPPDPGPGAMIGGMVGTGCSGTNAYRYGTMKEWVLSLTVVLADGTVIKTRQRPRKSSAGYDLTRTFIGSEGTLGLVTEATLRLTVLPQNTSVAVASFGSIRQAADCVARVVGAGVPVAAIEILDDAMMRTINQAGITSRSWQPLPTLFFKFAGTERGVKEQIGQVRDMAKKAGSTTFDFARGADEQEELWSARKEALWSTMSTKREGDHVWTGDVAVPISRLPDAIEAAQQDLKESGLFGTIVGHVGDGNFHAIVLYNDSQRSKAEDFVHRMVDRALEMEGTATGEHGVGMVKRDALVQELGQDTINAMRKLKQAFDPLCLLNCDKIIRMQKTKPGESSMAH